MNSIVILGKRGWGKSYLHARILAQCPYYLCIDTVGDIEFVDKPVTLTAKGIINIRHVQAQYRISIPDLVKTTSDIQSFFNNICRLLLLWGRGGKLQGFMFAVDEIQYFSGKLVMSDYLAEIVNLGRHFGIDYSFNTRRYPEIHKDIIANATEFYAGYSMDINDLKRMEYIFGKDNVSRFLDKQIPYGFLHKTDTVVDIALANDGGITYDSIF